MKKNYNNKKVKKTPYEIKENTAYFVKNRLPAFILAFLIIFWTIASIFGIIAYAKTKKADNQGVITASANAIDEFVMLRDFDIPLTPLSGYQNDNKYMYGTPHLVVRNRQVYLLDNYAYYMYLDGAETLDGYEITDSNGGLIPSPVFNAQPAIKENTSGVTFQFSSNSISAFDLNTVFLYDYYSPYSLDTSLYYDFGNPTIRFDFTLKLAFYRVGADVFNDPIIVGFYDYEFYIEIDVEMLYDDKSLFVLPAVGFIYNDDTVISDVNLQSLMLFTEYQPYAHDYYYMRTYRNDVADLQYQLDNLRSQLTALQAEYNQLLADYNSLGADYSILMERYEGANTIIVGLDERIAQLEATIIMMDDDYEEGIENLKSIYEQEISTLQTEIDTLRIQKETAYTDGRNVGYANGYDNGFIDGVSDANNYSFTGLLSAVFDVPVRTFTSLFNFDLLGINLANFFLSLLTCAICITVIRWII